jgi:hypothetical protein
MTSRADFEARVSANPTLHDNADGLLGYVIAVAREKFDEVDRLHERVVLLDAKLRSSRNLVMKLTGGRR